MIGNRKLEKGLALVRETLENGRVFYPVWARESVISQLTANEWK